MTRAVTTPSGTFTFSGVLPTKNEVAISPILEFDSASSGPPDHQVLCSHEQSSSLNTTLSVPTAAAPPDEKFSRPSSSRQAAKEAQEKIASGLKKPRRRRKSLLRRKWAIWTISAKLTNSKTRNMPSRTTVMYCKIRFVVYKTN